MPDAEDSQQTDVWLIFQRVQRHLAGLMKALEELLKVLAGGHSE